MTSACKVCGKSIDTENDEHYYCDCGGTFKAVCAQDALNNGRCPDCGNKLQFCEASITKDLYLEPGIRGLLGF